MLIALLYLKNKLNFCFVKDKGKKKQAKENAFFFSSLVTYSAGKIFHTPRTVRTCVVNDLQTCSSAPFYRVATSWKSRGFFLLTWKVLDFCLLVQESPGKMFIKFSRDLPGQNVKLFFFIITGTL